MSRAGSGRTACLVTVVGVIKAIIVQRYSDDDHRLSDDHLAADTKRVPEIASLSVGDCRLYR